MKNKIFEYTEDECCRIYTEAECSHIIEMAWEDRMPFEAIKREYGLSESGVIRLMRQNLKSSSFKLWRERVSGRKTKHVQLRSSDIYRSERLHQYTLQ